MTIVMVIARNSGLLYFDQGLVPLGLGVCFLQRLSGVEYKVGRMNAPIPRFDPANMLSFDLETTGTDPKTCRIVTSAMISIEGRERKDQELLADPGVEIPEQATAVHGITTEYARENGSPHDEVLARTIETIREAWQRGATLVVYNAPYDLSVLRALEPSFTVDGLVFDPLVVDRAMDPYRKGKRRLENVCEHYGIELTNAHEATADAVAAARVAWKLAKKYPQLAQDNGEELMVSQAQWFYESQIKLQEWFNSKGRDVTVGTSWPVQL